MRFYTKQHQYYCGIDLHARTMYLCVLNQAGEILVHRNLKAASEPFLKSIAPYREDLVDCVECIFTWDLAGRILRPRGDPLRPGTRPLYEGHPRREGQEREDRCPQNCCPPAWWHGAPSLCLTCRDARYQRPAPAPDASHAQTGRIAGPYPTYQQPV